MNEMNMLTRLRDEVPLGGIVRRAYRHSRLAITSAMAVAVAGGAFTVAGTGAAVHRPVATPMSVTLLAQHAASAAMAAPAVRPGQWVYRRVASGHTSVLETDNEWSTADGTRAASVVHGQLRIVHITTGAPVMYQDLSSLPRDPAALARLLASKDSRGTATARARFAFTGIGTMLMDYVMPPRLTAEMFHALGHIRGVAVNTHARDIAGRHGVAFQLVIGRDVVGGLEREAIILNPRRFALMALQISLGNGEYFKESAILRQALVSSPGVRP